MRGTEPYLTFAAGGRAFAVAGSRVLEVMRYSDAHDGVTLADLNALLGGSAAVVGPRTCVIAVRVGVKPIGIVVDEASDVVTFAPGELLDPPDFGPNVELPYLAGLAKQGDYFAIVLDVDRLFSRLATDREAA